MWSAVPGALLIGLSTRATGPATVVPVTGDLQRAVGRNLRRIRDERGVTQESLGDTIGRHRTYVGAIERGERNLGLQTIESLADALGVDPFLLLARDG